MRALFDRFSRVSVPIRYTVGGGQGVARSELIYNLARHRVWLVPCSAYAAGLNLCRNRNDADHSPTGWRRERRGLSRHAGLVRRDGQRQAAHERPRLRRAGRWCVPGYADHPRVLVDLPKLKIQSTAAGRYQLLRRYYDAYKKTLGLKDFSPLSQDLIALQQIRERARCR